jgi:hypothetical protein
LKKTKKKKKRKETSNWDLLSSLPFQLKHQSWVQLPHLPFPAIPPLPPFNFLPPPSLPETPLYLDFKGSYNSVIETLRIYLFLSLKKKNPTPSFLSGRVPSEEVKLGL